MLFRSLICCNKQQINCNYLLKNIFNNINKKQIIFGINSEKRHSFSTLINNNLNKCKTNSTELRINCRRLKTNYSREDMKRFRDRELKSKNRDVVLYSTAFVLVVFGAAYAAVPIYRIYCKTTGKGGKPFIDEKAVKKIVDMKRNDNRIITVTFSAETTSQMQWNFKPTQPELKCAPGETVLAFFTAKNPLDRPVDGINHLYSLY